METPVLAQTTEAPAKSKHWTVREGETGILHGKLVGRGGFGEVHEVDSLSLSFN